MAIGGHAPLWRWQRITADAAPMRLDPVDFTAIDGWASDDHRAALMCYLQSAKGAGLPLPPEELQDRVGARRFFEENFAPFRIAGDIGLLTAYFEPELKGSRTRSPAFDVPVYRRPPDLSPLPEGHPLTASCLTAGRKTDSGFEPYSTRADIEAGALQGRGLEILFLACPIEAFIMHVQGSGFVALNDGGSVRLTFDGKNGHPYTSIAKHLVAQGHLKAEDAHLEGMIDWLRAQPDPRLFLNRNESYIFFKELSASAEGPLGSSGAALQEGRSLAADPLYHPSGTLIWVSAPALNFEGAPFQRLLTVQDSGSAITGPQRGDVFAGMGVKAGRIAGRVRHECQFIILRPKR